MDYLTPFLFENRNAPAFISFTGQKIKFQRYRLKASFNEFDLPNDFKEKQETVKNCFVQRQFSPVNFIFETV